MPRPKQHRKVFAPPKMQGYKPFGIPRAKLGSVVLQVDEYEAVRLLDYEGLLQEQAAEKMNVSRPTLTRIYDQARKTIAKAFVEGKMILIEGGKVQFDDEWHRCGKCHQLVKGRHHHGRCGCGQVNAENLKPIHTDES